MRRLLIISTIILCFSCKEKDRQAAPAETRPIQALAQDSNLHLVNGTLYYAGKLFNGTLSEKYPGGQTKSRFAYRYGRQDGLSETFYEDGKPESKRWYARGEKDSVHSGWWPNGHVKYEYHFDKGNYEGWFSEWYQSGSLVQQVLYKNGKEVCGKGWRENGKLYMSFVMKNNRRYGLFNANLCYSLTKESIR